MPVHPLEETISIHVFAVEVFDFVELGLIESDGGHDNVVYDLIVYASHCCTRPFRVSRSANVGGFVVSRLSVSVVVGTLSTSGLSDPSKYRVVRRRMIRDSSCRHNGYISMLSRSHLVVVNGTPERTCVWPCTE